jgi:hypothetical protein
MAVIAEPEHSTLPTVGYDPEPVYPSPILSFTCILMLSPPVYFLAFQMEI